MPYGRRPRLTLIGPRPVEVIVNGQPFPLAQESTVADLLEQLGLTGKPVAVELNLQVVPRQRHAQQRIAPGDRLEIVTLVGGG